MPTDEKKLAIRRAVKSGASNAGNEKTLAPSNGRADFGSPEIIVLAKADIRKRKRKKHLQTVLFLVIGLAFPGS